MKTIINIKTDKMVILFAPLVPSKKLAKIIIRAEKDIRRGINLSPVFNDPKEMDRYLQAMMDENTLHMVSCKHEHHFR